MPLSLIVFNRMVYPDPKFLMFKTKKWLHFFLRLEAVFLITQGISNTFIEIKISVAWFSRDCVCNKIENLSNINEINPLGT